MTIVKTPQKHYPKAEITRLGMALVIGFLGAWLVSSLLGSNDLGIQFAQIFVFILTWMVLRVLIVYNNQGQSLRRWAFNLKVLEVDHGQIVSRIPVLQVLLQREGIICFRCFLGSIFLRNIIANPTAILLVLPPEIDCGVALSDTQMRLLRWDSLSMTAMLKL